MSGGAQSAAAGAGASAPSSSSRNRKRRAQASKAQRQAAQAQGAGGSQQHSVQQGFAGGPRGSFAANQMPPPGMHPQHGPPLTGMGLGSVPSDEDMANFILDDLDKLTGRDVAMARYRRNHELLNLIFDARRIDALEPSQSPYAENEPTALQEQRARLDQEIETMRAAHTLKYRRWRDEVNEQDAILHAPPKRLRLQRAEQIRQQSVNLDNEGAEERHGDDETSAWASKPSRGSIVGVGFVRAVTPEEVRKLLPRSPEPEPTTVAPKSTSSTTVTATPQTSLTALNNDSSGPATTVSAEATTANAGTEQQTGTAGPLSSLKAETVPAHVEGKNTTTVQSSDAVPTDVTMARVTEPSFSMDVDKEELAAAAGDEGSDDDDNDDDDGDGDEDDNDNGDDNDDEGGGDDLGGDDSIAGAGDYSDKKQQHDHDNASVRVSSPGLVGVADDKEQKVIQRAPEPESTALVSTSGITTPHEDSGALSGSELLSSTAESQAAPLAPLGGAEHSDPSTLFSPAPVPASAHETDPNSAAHVQPQDSDPTVTAATPVGAMTETSFSMDVDENADVEGGIGGIDDGSGRKDAVASLAPPSDAPQQQMPAQDQDPSGSMGQLTPGNPVS